jgi:Tol biopolymer transport system component
VERQPRQADSSWRNSGWRGLRLISLAGGQWTAQPGFADTGGGTIGGVNAIEWSPDSSDIGFSQSRASRTALFAEAPSDSTPRLVSCGANDQGFSWAPDARTIAFNDAATNRLVIQDIPARPAAVDCSLHAPTRTTAAASGLNEPDWRPDVSGTLFVAYANPESMDELAGGEVDVLRWQHNAGADPTVTRLHSFTSTADLIAASDDGRHFYSNTGSGVAKFDAQTGALEGEARGDGW